MAKCIVVDIEADGPIPGPYSMISFGAVLITPKLDTTFYGQIKPISDKYIPESLAVSGHTREETLNFDEPVNVMHDFAQWIKSNVQGQPVFFADNNGFDFAFINYYFHKFYGSNPFGWSSRRIGDLFCGFYNDSHYKWKIHKKTKHTHHPVDDAKGNAAALLYLQSQGFKIKF